MRLRTLLCSLAALTVVATACDTGDGRSSLAETEAGPDQTATILTTSVPADDPVITAGTAEAPTTTAPAALALVAPWPDEGAIVARYTCQGENVSPALSWEGIPAGTQELALVMIDISADGFVHWVMTGLAPERTGLAEGEVPEGAAVAVNDFAEAEYGGPCPPETHSYLLTLYALGQQLELVGDETGAELLQTIEAAVLQQVSVGGTYTPA